MMVPKQKSNVRQHELTIREHVAEFRRYVLLAITSILFFGCLTHYYRNELVGVLMRPLGGADGMTLQFLSPLDPLLFILTLDFFGGMLLSLPVILWGLYRFTAPALPRVSRVTVVWVLCTFTLLGIGAIAYGYLVAIPLTLSVLTGITVPGTQAAFTADGYLSFFLTALLMLVLVFEMPLGMVALAKLGILNPHALAAQRKYVYLGLLVAVAGVTPTTDLISLALILLPTYAVFELGLMGARMVTITKH